jgi:hypothetical protein
MALHRLLVLTPTFILTSFLLCFSAGGDRGGAASAETVITLAQNQPRLAGTYEGKVARRFIGGAERETRTYR